MDYLAEIKKHEEAFWVFFSRNVSIIEAIGYTYPKADIDNLESYIAHRCVNIHAMFQTFYKSYATQIDVLSANSFLRIFADHISSLFLIYETGSGKETILRHYLSIADSCETDLEALKELGQSKNINDEGRHYVQTEIKEKEAVCQHCVDAIKALPFYGKNKEVIDNLIQGSRKGYGKYNWKYIDLQTYDVKNIKGCSYSFARLYAEKLHLASQHVVNLSQYVHGLAGSVAAPNNIIVEAKMKTLAHLLIMSFSRFLWMKYNVPPSNIESDYLCSLI